jgi:hypothetical protein
MTIPELLTYSNEIEYRALAVLTNFVAILRQPRVQVPAQVQGPDFVMFRAPVWEMPRPERPPISHRKVYAAGFATGLCLSAASFAVLLMLVKP